MFKMLPLDALSGLQSAKDQTMNFVKPAVNTVVVPILDVGAVGFLLFFIFGCVNRHRNGEEYKDKVIGIIICAVVIVLVSTFPIWGWQMVS